MPTASQQWQSTTALARFVLGRSNVNRYKGEDHDDAYANELEDASQADDGSAQNVQNWRYSWFPLGTRNVDQSESQDCNDADANEEEEAYQVNDGSRQNVEYWGHSTRACEDWTVYFRPAEYNNGEANTTASDVSEAKTVL